jgi:hypothetical protein
VTWEEAQQHKRADATGASLVPCVPGQGAWIWNGSRLGSEKFRLVLYFIIFSFLSCFFFFFFLGSLICSSGWPQTSDPPASVSLVVGLLVCNIISSSESLLTVEDTPRKTLGRGAGQKGKGQFRGCWNIPGRRLMMIQIKGGVGGVGHRRANGSGKCFGRHNHRPW